MNNPYQKIVIFAFILSIFTVGCKQEKQEEKEEVIARCMEENMAPEVISKIVNLPLAEIKRIIDKIIGIKYHTCF